LSRERVMTMSEDLKRMRERRAELKPVAQIIPNQIHVFDNRIYEESKTEVWVFGILKKQLKELGVSILKTHNFNGDWGFLMTVADGEKVKVAYPKKKVGDE